MEYSKNLGITPPSESTEEEKKKEDEVLKEAKEDEVRSQVVEDYGLDEDVDSEKIDKLVQKELQHKKDLSTAIRQKRDWRAKAEETPKPKEEDTTDKGKKEEEKIDESKFITKEELDERDRKKDIESLEVSDELKKEVESYAKLHGVSAKQAFSSDYIQFRKGQEDTKSREEEASAGGGRGTGTVPKISAITNDEELSERLKKIDMATEEGRKEHEAIQKELREQ